MTGVDSRARRWLLGRRAARRAGWRPTDALLRAAVCGFGLAVAGVLTHRLELLLMGAPLLVSMLLVTPPAGTPVVRAVRLPATADAGGSGTATIAVEPGEGAVLTAVRLPVASRSGIGPVHLLPAVTGRLRTTVAWRHWGQATYLRPDHLLASHDGLYVFGPVVGHTATRTVLPPVEPLPLPSAPLPPRAAGLVGAHRSVRAGNGTELRDIRPFQAGDRLRWVDWRVSLRAAAGGTGELVPSTVHVRERHAETDADLVLALDTTLDVGVRIADWSVEWHGAEARPGGSLDLGVRAVCSLAAAFLRQGDRVGLVDIGHPRGGVAVGSGHRQLQRIRHQLVLAAQRVGGTGEPVLRAAQLPPGATVVLLSPFLDDKVADLAVRTARRGNLVLAVDLLPADLEPDEETVWGEAVRTLVVAEQRVRLAVLAQHGVLVTRWGDGSGVSALLRAARRRTRAPR